MSPCGLDTTLPVQWCEVNDPSEVPNSVPTCAVPENASPSSGSDTLIEFEIEFEFGFELGLVLGLDDEVGVWGGFETDDALVDGLAVAEATAVLPAVAVGTELKLTSLRWPPTFA